MSNTSATVLAVNSDLDTDRVRQRGGRKGLAETVVMVSPSFKRCSARLSCDVHHSAISPRFTRADRSTKRPKLDCMVVYPRYINRTKGFLAFYGEFRRANVSKRAKVRDYLTICDQHHIGVGVSFVSVVSRTD